jgi:hypothetical protein
MSTPTSDTMSDLVDYSPLPHTATNEFARIWNACSDYNEALVAIHAALGLSLQEIRLTAKTLYKTGDISPLPVTDGSDRLTEEDVLRFAVVWNRSSSLGMVAKALGLPLASVSSRARLLRDLGVLLQPLTDFNFAPAALPRTEVWDVSPTEVNDLLNGELIVRNGLLRQAPLRQKTAAMVGSVARMKSNTERSVEQETFLSLAESFLRELGVF